MTLKGEFIGACDVKHLAVLLPPNGFSRMLSVKPTSFIEMHSNITYMTICVEPNSNMCFCVCVCCAFLNSVRTTFKFSVYIMKLHLVVLCGFCNYFEGTGPVVKL